MIDRQLTLFGGAIFALLIIATILAIMLQRRPSTPESANTRKNLLNRIQAWWVICVVLALTVLCGDTVTVILFALISFAALREFITLTPTVRADHAALFWCFFIILPCQYILTGMQWYGLFAVFIPIYAFLFIPARIALAGNPERFMERAAKIQWGLMISVYFISHIPALLMLRIPGYEHQNIKLLLYLVLVTQISDVLQYVFGKLLGRHPAIPGLSPNKTIEGYAGGGIAAIAIGTILFPLTPFSPLAAGVISAVIVLAGMLGGICMSAVKRDRGVKDFGAFIRGHGGMMDRMDSLCFAAPLFFHIVRFCYSA